jgi:integrase
MNARKGSTVTRGATELLRVRIGKGERLAFTVPSGLTDVEARKAAIVDVANRLVAAGLVHHVRRFADQVLAAQGPREIRIVLLAADKVCASREPLANMGETFGDFALRWTSGELTRQYPDHVREKGTASKDAGRLQKHILPHVRNIPLRAFTLDDAQRVMAQLPAALSTASRRHVAQIMYRLFRLAVFPARVLKVSPLPAGFLPKLGAKKAKVFLYPDEEAKLLRCEAIPFGRRLLWGFLAREGMREGEALALEWRDLDLARGAVTLDKNKTDDPRAWALRPDVVRALASWQAIEPMRPFDVPAHHLAAQLRSDLATAGVDRAELTASTEARRPIRVHDLRATFVTLSLAAGKSETWVMDRTGHRSSTMVSAYRRVSRTASELGLGELVALDEALGGSHG